MAPNNEDKELGEVLTSEPKASDTNAPAPSAAAALNWKNYGNLVAFILNTVFTFGVGTLGMFGNPTNADLSEKYQTLITPKTTAFVIWSVIFTFQGVFSVLQMIGSFRGRKIVQDGVSFWYIAVCAFQISWTFAFAYEVIWLSVLFMLLIWVSLMALIISQYYVEPDDEGPESSSPCSLKGLIEFWFLKFPFSIHGGWITAASALNISVITVDNQSSAATQLAVGIVCLAALHALSVWNLFGYKKPNYTIAIVLIWATGWIYGELQNPKPLIVTTFDASIVDGAARAALSVSIIICIQVVLRVAFFTYNYFKGTSYLQG